jgi:hypothetical protein
VTEVSLRLNENGDGAFYLTDGAREIAEMVINVTKPNLTVYHTEVLPEMEGNGLAKMMLDAMVDYARKNDLRVIPLCPYVHAQFKRHSKDYADIWKRD